MLNYKNAITGIITIAILALSACSKKAETNPVTDHDGERFVGTWVGTYDCNPGITTRYVISAGSDGNTVTGKGTVGFGNCVNEVTTTLKTTGKFIEMAQQTFPDNCNNAFILSGGGSIEGSTLTLNLHATGVVHNTCTFTGRK